MNNYQSKINVKTINDAGIFEGYASVFDYQDHHQDIVCRGAFQKTIAHFQDLKTRPKMLWQHDPAKIIGSWLSIHEDEHGLFVKGKLFRNTQYGEEAYVLLKGGALDGLSIGFEADDTEFDPLKNVRFIKNVTLHEISLVTFAANDQAKVLHVKSTDQNNTNTSQIKGNRFMKTTYAEKASSPSEFKQFIKTGVSTKSLTSENSGGYTIASTLLGHIDDQRNTSNMRYLCNVETINSSVLELLMERGNASAGWVNETEDRAETSTAELYKVKIQTHEIYAKPKISQRLIDDSVIDIEQWVLNKINAKMDVLENTAFLHGNGENQPRGILTYDKKVGEIREHGVLQKIETGEMGAITVESLISAMNALPVNHLNGAVWVVSRATLGVIRTLKDQQGQYVTQHNLRDDATTTILGYPVVVNDAMTNLDSEKAADVVIFGNFKNGYQIVDRQDVNIMRDPYSSKPFVEFYATKRVGGDVIDFDAFKIIQSC